MATDQISSARLRLAPLKVADAGRRQAERIASAVQTYLGLAARHRAGTRRIHP